jgi:hypothetical protein
MVHCRAMARLVPGTVHGLQCGEFVVDEFNNWSIKACLALACRAW